jgi:WD40 repeat protein
VAFGFEGSVAFSPDGQRLATAGRDRTVKVWDAATGQEARTLQGHTGAVTSVAFSPDGKRLASAGQDQTVKVWDAATGQEVLTLQGHGTVVASVAFSPDGHWLAAEGASSRGRRESYASGTPGPLRRTSDSQRKCTGRAESLLSLR